MERKVWPPGRKGCLLETLEERRPVWRRPETAWDAGAAISGLPPGCETAPFAFGKEVQASDELMDGARTRCANIQFCSPAP